MLDTPKLGAAVTQIPMHALLMAEKEKKQMPPVEETTHKGSLAL